MKHELPNLPFPKNALEPYISAETFDYHHGRHHRAYVEKLNTLIQGTEFESMSLDQIIAKSTGPIFNNAAQTWNHSFFWNCLSAQRSNPRGDLLTAINQEFGSVDQLKDDFNKAAIGLFGSGWVWLVRDNKDGSISIQTTSNADNPLRHEATPLLTLDVWEHAYYIDYRNERPKFIQAFWNILNWEFAEKNFNAAKARSAAA
ncbi:MAG: superoxide dismutase [Bdellovibrionales bacterium RIFOXYC1_FULL_54_43]|nr:MAG: superoxide dismutase [Bdellovibrionales bacterium RIFOXYC1_FULL_54_43]OFZ84089.1 MAG: superoxide dismutase [Bdellovibrionales bacterium RIFOXYD1_FULL_55_31]